MNSPALVVALVNDLMVRSRVESALRLANHAVVFYDPTQPLLAQTGRHDADARPVVGLVDLAARSGDPMKLVAEMRARDMPVVGFCGHADTATRTAARAAGVTVLASNSMVAENLPLLIEQALAWLPDPDCDYC